MTKAIVQQDIYQSPLKKGDRVVIDSYVIAPDDRAYVAVIRESDGLIDLVQPCLLTAIEGTY